MNASRLFAALVILAAAVAGWSQSPPVTVNRLGITYHGLPASFFVSKDTVNGWIAATPVNRAAISDHRWNLWAAMNADSGEILNGTPLPIWETWFDGTDVFLDRPANTMSAAKRLFNIPRQLVEQGMRLEVHGRQLDTSALSFNRFTREMKDHIQDPNHLYYSLASLDKIHNGFPPETKLVDRKIADFPNTSVMIKPVFWIVSGTEPQMVPYWKGSGPEATADPKFPTPLTWKQCVLVDPAGTAKNDVDRVCNPAQKACGKNCGNTVMKAGSYAVVRASTNPRQSDFYALKLGADEIANLRVFNMLLVASNIDSPLRDLKNGDLALFVAMHAATRENDNWTWQTFWWLPPAQKPVGEPPQAELAPASMPAPWNRYASCTAYFMVDPPSDPNGKPVICFNPYLETGLTEIQNVERTTNAYTGMTTNCVSCHRTATYPQPQDNCCNYVIAGNVQPDNPLWFLAETKTDFLWSIPTRAHNPPFVKP